MLDALCWLPMERLVKGRKGAAPNWLLPEEARFTPPRYVLPPSGTETVVSTLKKEKVGSSTVTCCCCPQAVPENSPSTANAHHP